MTVSELITPPIERGDFVRLKEPYNPGPSPIDQNDKFTHGTVVEIVSRYPAEKLDTTKSTVIEFKKNNKGLPRNVSLHLFNPETGLMYIEDHHPTEPGTPMFVDFHISELILIHKHDEPWGNEYELDVAEIYDNLGIEVI